MKIMTYIGRCCREWVLAVGYPVNRCGYCGQRPQRVGPDTYYDDKEKHDDQ